LDHQTEPTTRDLLWDGSVEVLCFGAATGDWALRGMTPEENERHNPGIVGRLRTLLDRHRVGRLYLPSPGRFNGQLARPEELGVSWMDGLMFRGAYAEGVTLGKIGEAVGIASSDCPTIIARNARSLLAVGAHAGRESLYDLADLFSGHPARKYASVVDAIVEALAADGPMDGISAHVTCGIGPMAFEHRLDDPVHGDRNRRLCAYVTERWGAQCAGDRWFSLGAIISAQFRARGVPNERLSHRHDCTYSHKDGNRPRWNSHRRDRDGKRNFVLAIRRK